MERSRGSPRLSAADAPHADAVTGWTQSSLLCTSAGEGNVRYCCGSAQVGGISGTRGGYDCLAPSRLHRPLPNAHVPFIGLEKTPGAFKTVEPSSFWPSNTKLLSNPPRQICFTWLQLQRKYLTPSYCMYLNDWIFLNRSGWQQDSFPARARKSWSSAN